MNLNCETKYRPQSQMHINAWVLWDMKVVLGAKNTITRQLTMRWAY